MQCVIIQYQLISTVCLDRIQKWTNGPSEISGSIFFCLLQDVCREPIVKMNPQRRNIICVAIPLRWIPLQISRSRVAVENKTIFWGHISYIIIGLFVFPANRRGHTIEAFSMH